jgi:hypothetical protein
MAITKTASDFMAMLEKIFVDEEAEQLNPKG